MELPNGRGIGPRLVIKTPLHTTVDVNRSSSPLPRCVVPLHVCVPARNGAPPVHSDSTLTCARLLDDAVHLQAVPG